MSKDKKDGYKKDRVEISYIAMLILSLFMCFAELIVGHTTHSIALVADSFHMLFDIISLLIGFVSHHLSKQTPDEKLYPFGWSRASAIGGFINSSFLLSLCLIIFRHSTERIIHIQEVENTTVVLVTSILGLIVNIIGFFIFHSLDNKSFLTNIHRKFKAFIKKHKNLHQEGNSIFLILILFRPFFNGCIK
uniref:Zinc/cadmium resistance protein (Trinotate prediction) n=1 Tax=Henneguya salminicola TaxID=69463 RepID=A0A6G3MGK0_HENSL